MEIIITINTEKAVKDTSKIVETLKNKNLRRTKIEQLKSNPKEDELDIIEWTNVITVLISSGFALGVVKSIFDLLKGKFVDLEKTKIEDRRKEQEIKTNLEIERLKSESNERIELSKIKQQKNYFEISFECKEKKYNFKFTKEDIEQEQAIYDANIELEKNCK